MYVLKFINRVVNMKKVLKVLLIASIVFALFIINNFVFAQNSSTYEENKNYRFSTKDIKSEEIYFTSISAFLPHVLYISPLLNEYLFKTQQFLYDGFKDIDTIKLSNQYKPYSWIPHTTIAKTLSQEELNKSFSTLQDKIPHHSDSRCVFS